MSTEEYVKYDIQKIVKMYYNCLNVWRKIVNKVAYGLEILKWTWKQTTIG